MSNDEPTLVTRTFEPRKFRVPFRYRKDLTDRRREIAMRAAERYMRRHMGAQVNVPSMYVTEHGWDSAAFPGRSYRGITQRESHARGESLGIVWGLAIEIDPADPATSIIRNTRVPRPTIRVPVIDRTPRVSDVD